MQDVFISYAHQDRSTADMVCRTLENHGTKCWIAPRDILPGMSWSEAIIDGIEESRIVLLIFSESANKSPQVCREIERAVHKGVAVLPLRIENIEPYKEFEYFLGSVHWLDAWEPAVENHLPQVLNTVTAMLKRLDSRSQNNVNDLTTKTTAPPLQERRTEDRRAEDRRVGDRRQDERRTEVRHIGERRNQDTEPETLLSKNSPGTDHQIAEEIDYNLVKAGLDHIELKAGDILFRQGEPGDSMYMLQSGEMNVLMLLPDGEERTLFSVEPMAILGEMSLLLNSVRTATLVAATDACLWRVTHQKFQDGLKNRDRWAIKLTMGIAQTLARHVEAMNKEVITQITYVQKLQNELQPESAAELEGFCDRLMDRWTL